MADRDIMMGSGLLNPPGPDNLWGQEGAEFAGLTDAQKMEYFNRLDASKLEQQRRAETGGGPLARELQDWDGPLPEYENWRKELIGEIGPRWKEQEQRDFGVGGAMSGMLNPPAETIAEMMIEERGPMPDEFGNMTPVPSSDEEAVKQDFRRVLADGTVGELRQYIEMNIGDLEFLAQTDNSIAKDLEAALRFISTGTTRTSTPWDQSRFQGPSPDQNLRTWGDVLAEDKNIAQKTFEPPPLMEGSYQAMDEDRFDPLTYLEMFDRAPFGEATPDMLPREGRQPYQTAPGYDTLLEPYPRARGYAHGGYVRGRGRGRGTMPGELHPKGSLSVRVAGESMGEYKKHREDEVRPVRRTLDNALSPTLSRRMFS